MCRNLNYQRSRYQLTTMVSRSVERIDDRLCRQCIIVDSMEYSVSIVLGHRAEWEA